MSHIVIFREAAPGVGIKQAYFEASQTTGAQVANETLIPANGVVHVFPIASPQSGCMHIFSLG